MFLRASWDSVIMHLDGDAFFASCEQSMNPAYQGKPVVTGQERNIIASLSYEAKACGIRRGTPVWQARKICPSLIVLPSDYETYSLISKRMFSIVRRYTPIVEESSIDEGYADLKGLRRLYRKSYAAIAQEIQAVLCRELGFTISVGLSVTKTLSKLAAKFEKPHGFTVVKGRAIGAFLQKTPVSEVCGIGPNSTALLHKYRVYTAYDFVMQSSAWVKTVLGKVGVELWCELRGESVYPLNPVEKTTYQTIVKSKTFTPPSSTYAYVKAQAVRNLESAFIKMRRYALGAQRVAVFIKQQDFHTVGCECELNRITDAVQDVMPCIERMLAEIFRPGVWYRATGVCVSRLSVYSDMQFDLFVDPVRMKHMRTLASTIDHINAAYGKHSVGIATGLFLTHRKQTAAAREGRCAISQRKTDLLPGETFRQRVRIPLWKIVV